MKEIISCLAEFALSLAQQAELAEPCIFDWHLTIRDKFVSGVLASVASSGEEAPSPACTVWMCGEHLVSIITLYKLTSHMSLRSGHITRSPPQDTRCGHITSLQATPRSVSVLCPPDLINTLLIRLSWPPGRAASPTSSWSSLTRITPSLRPGSGHALRSHKP